VGEGLSMNQLVNYLMGRMGKRTCPIISIERVFYTGFNSPWKDWIEIKFKDGSVVKLVEKPE
jgi:hypothetical protein